MNSDIKNPNQVFPFTIFLEDAYRTFQIFWSKQFKAYIVYEACDDDREQWFIDHVSMVACW